LLAIRIAALSKAPPNVLRILANDDAIDVASPVLIQSKQLDDACLIGCAKSKSQEHLLAISRRKALAEALTDILVERGDSQVVLSTARNAGAKFSNKGFNILVNRSDGYDRLAICVGNRRDIPRHIFQRLLEVASTQVRLKLEAESPCAKRDIRSVVKEVTTQIESRSAIQSPKYAAAETLINALNLAGQLDAAKLEEFAKAGRFEEVVAALSLMSNMSIDFVERTMNDVRAETLLILSSSIGLPWTTTKNILTFCNRKQWCTADEMERYLVAFRRLKKATALQILNFHRTRERASTENAKRRRSLPDF
jgi:uncharacterized protein (DUF2336 family)